MEVGEWWWRSFIADPFFLGHKYFDLRPKEKKGRGTLEEREGVCATHQQPPGPSRRSKTRIVLKQFSRASASTAMAPDGPAPMTATRLAGLMVGMAFVPLSGSSLV